jgi:hypothetical protein
VKNKKINEDFNRQTHLFPSLAPYTHISPNYFLRFKRNNNKKIKNRQKEESFPIVSKAIAENTRLNSTLFKKIVSNLLKPQEKRIKSEIS